jgi:hypothetical protein
MLSEGQLVGDFHISSNAMIHETNQRVEIVAEIADGVLVVDDIHTRTVLETLACRLHRSTALPASDGLG